MAPGSLPAPLIAAGARSAVTLDVRPVLDAGGDPFSLILKTVRGLEPEVALHLLVSFEPVPLYAVLSGLGRLAHTEQHGEVYEVWFYSSPGGPDRTALSERSRGPATSSSCSGPLDFARGERGRALQAPVELDVRGLEPPQPMIAILQKLVDLGPGAQLRVRHHREPVMLYDKLKLRGYAATCTPQPEGDFLVQIAPEWALRGA